MAINSGLLNAVKKQIHKNSNITITKKELDESTDRLISFIELLITVDQGNTTYVKKST